jgi:hypothetical protein
MNEPIAPNRQALTEALALSTEILKNIELSELPLTNIALKSSRLARLLNDFDMQRTLEHEIAGYPTTPTSCGRGFSLFVLSSKARNFALLFAFGSDRSLKVLHLHSSIAADT